MISKYYEEYLKNLVDICGVSGYSWKIGETFINEALKNGIAQVGMDTMGSASARIPFRLESKNLRPKNVMVCAHLDTPGFIVLSITSDTSLSAVAVGGMNTFKETLGRLVTSTGEYIPVRIKDYDISDESVTVSFEPKYKDTIRIGDPIFFHKGLRTGRGKYFGPGLDNKAGILILTMLMKELVSYTYLYHNIFCVLTSLEETGGSHGAFTAASKIKPLFAINIDVFDTHKRSEIGSGVRICVGPLINKVLSDLAIDTAKKFDIPYNVKVEPGYLCSDTEELVKSNGGTPTLEINIPCYDIHSPEESVSKKDIVSAVYLLKNMCFRFKEILTLLPGGTIWAAQDVLTNGVV